MGRFCFFLAWYTFFVTSLRIYHMGAEDGREDKEAAAAETPLMRAQRIERTATDLVRNSPKTGVWGLLNSMGLSWKPTDESDLSIGDRQIISGMMQEARQIFSDFADKTDVRIGQIGGELKATTWSSQAVLEALYKHPDVQADPSRVTDEMIRAEYEKLRGQKGMFVE